MSIPIIQNYKAVQALCGAVNEVSLLQAKGTTLALFGDGRPPSSCLPGLPVSGFSPYRVFHVMSEFYSSDLNAEPQIPY